MHPKEIGHGFMKDAAERWLAADDAHRAMEAGVTVEPKTLAAIRAGGDPCATAPQPASCTSTDGRWILEQVRAAVRHRGPGVVGLIVGAWLIWLSLLLRGRVRRRRTATASAS
jgi:hypothetical protein